MRGPTVLLGCVLLLGTAPAAVAHPERHAFFPDGSVGAVPKYRTHSGQLLVVCKGQTVPFTVGWHASDRPVRIDYGVGSLPIPG
jgi:hypothetical protein